MKMIKNNVGNAEKPQKPDDDLVITSTERLGPDPSVLSKGKIGDIKVLFLRNQCARDCGR